MKKCFFTSLLIIFSLHSYAQEVIWQGEGKSISIGQNVYVLEDKEGSYTIDDVTGTTLRNKFVLSQNKVLSFGFTESYNWIRFTLNNSTNQQLLLELEQAFLPIADLYFRDTDGGWITYNAGYKVNLYQKEIKHHFQLFPLPEGSTEIYIRVLAYENPVPVKIWEKNAYEIKANIQKIVYGLYSGILIFVIINNLMLFFTFRKISYALYVLLVLFYVATSAAVMDGYILYLFPQADMLFWYSNIPAFNMPVALLYCITFIELQKYSPRTYKFALIMLGYFTFMALTHQFYSIIPATIINQINALVLFLLITSLAIRVGIKGSKLGYYFALAYFIWFLLVLVEVIYIQAGNPPHIFEVSHVSIAIFIEVFILSYLLSKRFEWERIEIEAAEEEAQSKLLVQTAENERIVREQNIILEDKVNERTTQLKDTNVELTGVLQTVEEEKQKSDSLLLNILPALTARELKELGEAKPQTYNMVSVLFTDFKDFTRLTSIMDPEKLVHDLHECFSAFDRIVQQHGIEKIKTIGDSYMAAGGIPVPTAMHALDTVRAAIDIRDFMHNWNIIRTEKKLPLLEVRIGIHSGPVVSGVVGTHKFAYDIWGDTVNVAARLEKNGEPGKVNVSISTYELIKDYFRCAPRGKIKVKGKGELEMYWVEQKK